MDFNLTTIGPALADTSAHSNARTWKDFVALINTSWRKSAGDFIACGRHLIAARDELACDAFNVMVKSKLDFEASVARKLLCIAANETLCAHVHRLPPCWSTIYELSQLSESVLKAAFADGRIHPGMMRKDAITLKPAKKTTAKSAAAGKTSASTNPTELSTVWKTASADQRQRFLDQVGRAELCAAMTTALKADLRDHLVALAVAGASKSSSFAIYSTDKLHVALRCAEQPEPDEESIRHMIAALGCIAKKAQARGITRSDVVIAEGKPRARRK
jgi:hypothetical protein